MYVDIAGNTIKIDFFHRTVKFAFSADGIHHQRIRRDSFTLDLSADIINVDHTEFPVGERYIAGYVIQTEFLCGYVRKTNAGGYGIDLEKRNLARQRLRDPKRQRFILLFAERE